MGKKFLYTIGLAGVFLFFFAAFIGSVTVEDYNSISQLISESYARNTPYSIPIRLFGYIPAGICFTLFAFGVRRLIKGSLLVSIGLAGIGIFYGVATIIAGLFPCDEGCIFATGAPTFSNMVHNFTGIITYLFTPCCILMTGVGIHHLYGPIKFVRQTYFLGVMIILFVVILTFDSGSAYIGLFQRVVEGAFLFWIVLCAKFVKNN
ncbi:DUF998 domain-containing protein [Robertkochia solimangrovi]|uniref:DUF998 domain-containing protein n=1 Tax=Robertkochia solimangrovi TaxID=2213046 RepID=UPI0013A53AFD|nr:DUF998 domain-containing protein [Robertkochia solimangrovi]